MKRIRRAKPEQADLDITAFMNLMIVLVPVLLLGMVFSQISVIDVKLPAGISEENSLDANNKQVELLIHPTELRVNFPQGILLKRIPKSAEGEYDFETLSLVLQEVKRQLREKGIEKKSITILSGEDTDYQTIISTMDTVRSFKAVVAASVVDAALFPEISFGDAPPKVGVGS
jgi:biopolymer transport protein ExbD